MATRILLVDDDPTVRFKYERLLEHAGIAVDTATNGEEALERLGPNHGYHLVISDLNMPGLDGLGLVSKLRSIPRLKILPVLMLTSSTDERDLLDNLGAGVSDYVLKTCSSAEFMARVQNLARMTELTEELARASRTDPLTNLANRRFGVERLEEEMNRARRYDRQLAVGIIDIDHFKRVNDTLGHQAGDEVLVSVSSTLDDVSRETDCVIRWGGEEFLFVFPETTLDEASSILERFREYLEQNPIDLTAGHGTSLPVTISGGVAQLEWGDTLESLVDRADTALYRAKEDGRNRLLMWRAGELLPVCAA